MFFLGALLVKCSNLFVDEGHLFYHPLHHRPNVAWLYGVQPISRLNALADHLEWREGEERKARKEKMKEGGRRGKMEGGRGGSGRRRKMKEGERKGRREDDGGGRERRK